MALPQWLVTVAGTMIVAVLGYLLGLRKSKQETRWHAKHEAYQSILKALHDIHYWAEETYSTTLMLPSVGSARLVEAGHRFEEAKYEMSSYALVGGLVISEQSREILEDLLGQIAREEFRFEDDFGDDSEYPQRLAEHADHLRTIVSNRFADVLSEARSDLRGLSRIRAVTRRIGTYRKAEPVRQQAALPAA